jgi:uncharacterized protein YndB with AHSA1/START domain
VGTQKVRSGLHGHRPARGRGLPLRAPRAPDGVEHAFHGTYREVDPPRRLVHTTVYEGAPDSEAIDSFTFDDVEGGTLIRCRSEHSSLATRDMYVVEGMERGLTESHQRLDALIARLSEPPK